MTNDRSFLGFNWNQPKETASLSYNTVNQKHSPDSYEKVESTPASGNYWRKHFPKKYLNPAPRSQLGVPTNKTYSGKLGKFYKPILGNADFVRGNQFSVKYPYAKKPTFVEQVAMPNVTPKEGPVDYLGSNAKIVMRNNSPFYPYPSQHILENKNYWQYPKAHQYLNDQPIFNYGHGLMEGGNLGKYTGWKGYNPYLLEGFNGGCGCKGGNTGIAFSVVILILLISLGFWGFMRK